MDPRQFLPRLWLLTDERLGDDLMPAISRLPRASGIVFRHYTLNPEERRRLFDRVARRARRAGHMLLLAGPPPLAQAWGADGSHGRGPAGHRLRSAPVHDLAEIRAAERDGAAFLFLSPVFATVSHPDATGLGPTRFDRLAAVTRLPVIALGGVTKLRARRLRRAYGWGAIDAWRRNGKIG